MTATTQTDWRARAANLAFRGDAFIDGAYVSALSGATFPALNPADGRQLVDVAACDAADIDVAVAAARRVFEQGSWSRLAPKERKAPLMRLAELMRANADELALLITLDMGKPIGDSAGEVQAAARAFDYYAEAVDKVYGDIAPTDPAFVTLITREPLGVVAAITPWNYPLNLTCQKLAPALAVGNSVIAKPSERASLAVLRVGELAAEAGIPDGVVNIVPGLGTAAGTALARHMDVDKISFTGSSPVGKALLRYSGESNMKSVALECGGKSPNIVLADTPSLERAAAIAAEAAFVNQGEMCNAGTRLLVQRSIQEEFLELVTAAAAEWTPQDPLREDIKAGAMVDGEQTERVLGYVQSAIEDGASLHLGGGRLHEETGGHFLAPTIFTGVDNGSRLAREEVFGPVLATIAFDEVDEAIAIANDSPFGLAAAIWTSDVGTAHRASRALRAGMVYVNCYDIGDLSTPFGGYKQSGLGREKSVASLHDFTEVKATWIDVTA